MSKFYVGSITDESVVALSLVAERLGYPNLLGGNYHWMGDPGGTEVVGSPPEKEELSNYIQEPLATPTGWWAAGKFLVYRYEEFGGHQVSCLYFGK